MIRINENWLEGLAFSVVLLLILSISLGIGCRRLQNACFDRLDQVNELRAEKTELLRENERLTKKLENSSEALQISQVNSKFIFDHSEKPKGFIPDRDLDRVPPICTD